MRTSLVASAALVVVVAACVTGGGGGGRASFLPVVPKNLPPPGEEPARVLQYEQVVRFELTGDGPVAVTTERRQVQILKDAGQKETEVGAGYSQSFDRIDRFEARVVDETGGTVKLWGTRDAADAPEVPDFALYDDSRSLVVDIPDQPLGRVVEGLVVKRTTSPQLFAFTHGFGEQIPVAASRFVVEVPVGMTIEYADDAAGILVDSKPVIEKTPELVRYTWERAALPALDTEPLLAPWNQLQPTWDSLREQVNVRLSSWTDDKGAVHQAPADAAGLSRFTYTMMRDQVQLTPEIQAQVKELLTGVPDDPRAKARKLYAWTRDSIRYCAVSVGMGGWVPHSSVEVDEHRYGDCKDKANLLKTLLKGAGIQSRLVIIWSGMWPEPFRLPVLAANFNHAILLVDLPTGPVWVDPTTRTTAFDALPPNDTDRYALPISEGGDALAATLASTPERERVLGDLALTLDKSGNAQGTFKLETSGAFADWLRDALLNVPVARHDQVVAEFLPLDDAKVAKLVIDNETPPEEVTPAFAHGDVVTQVSGPLAAGIDTVLSARTLFRPDVPTMRRDRRAPLALGFRQTRTAHAHIALPAGTSVSRLPDPVVVDSPFMHYTLTWTADGTGLDAKREVVFKVRTIAPTELAAFADVCDKSAAAEEQKVVLRFN